VNIINTSLNNSINYTLNRDVCINIIAQKSTGIADCDDSATKSADWQTEKTLSDHRAMQFNVNKCYEILIKYGNNPDGIPTLLYAIKQNDIDAVKILLDTGASPDTKAGLTYLAPQTAIDYAAMYGSLEMIDLLLQYGCAVRPSQTTEEGLWCIAAVCFAIKANRYENIQKLLSITPKSSMQVQPELSPLYWAIRHGDQKTLSLLLENGYSLDTTEDLGFAPLLLAVQNSTLDIIRYMISLGVDINQKDRSGSALYHAVANEKLDVVQFLLSEGADFKSEEGALWEIVIQSQNTELVHQFIKAQLDINARDKDRLTPLMRAIKYANSSNIDKSIDIIKMLIANDADVNSIPENYGNWCVKECPILLSLRHPRILKLLVEAGADVNIRLGQNKTPLHYLAEIGRGAQISETWTKESGEILLSNGAEINAVDLDLQTPLHYGCRSPVISALLMDHGANIHAKDHKGYKPFHFLYSGISDVDIAFLKELVQRGVSLHEFSPNGENALHGACCNTFSSNSLNVIRFLVEELKMDVNQHAKWGDGKDGAHTPLMSAIGCQKQRTTDFTILDYLLSKGANINAKHYTDHYNGRSYPTGTILDWAKMYDHAPHYVIEWLIQHGARSER